MVQPPVTAGVAVDATAASAIAVYVEAPQPDLPDSSAAARAFPYKYDSPRSSPKTTPGTLLSTEAECDHRGVAIISEERGAVSHRYSGCHVIVRGGTSRWVNNPFFLLL